MATQNKEIETLKADLESTNKQIVEATEELAKAKAELEAANAVNQAQSEEIDKLSKERDLANNKKGLVTIVDGYECEIMLQEVRIRKAGLVQLYHVDDEGKKTVNEDGVKAYLAVTKATTHAVKVKQV